MAAAIGTASALAVWPLLGEGVVLALVVISPLVRWSSAASAMQPGAYPTRGTDATWSAALDVMRC